MRLLGLTAAVLTVSCRSESVLQYVLTTIGSGGQAWGAGEIGPGAQVPFGAARLGPDTTGSSSGIAPGGNNAGYEYTDSYVRGFSHTHLVGAGAADFGNIGIMPYLGPVNSSMIPLTPTGPTPYAQAFTHTDEIATAGYYAVSLTDFDIRAEMTAAGSQTGVHRYSFPKSTVSPSVLFNPMHVPELGTSSLQGSVNCSGSTVTGSVLFKGGLSGRSGGLWVHFSAQVDPAPESVSFWQEGAIIDDSDGASGTKNVGAILKFAPGDAQVVTVHVAISFVSQEQAAANHVQFMGQDFDAVKERTQASWERLLGRIQIPEGTADLKTQFYSAFYRTHMAPTIYSEYGGVYLGMDNKVHTVPSGHVYLSDMSIWDTFRTENPWLTFISPSISQDIASSLVTMYEQGGDLPRWPIANVYSGCMIGNHADIVLLDTYVKGLRDWNASAAYEGMRLGAMDPHRKHNARAGLQDYIDLGYVPSEDDSCCASSLTLAYAYDDWAIGALASLLGHDSDAEMFSKRGQNYRNHWNSTVEFMCPRNKAGEFECPKVFNTTFYEDFQEGNPWQWSWFAPQDIDGLISLFPSKEAFVEKLQTAFVKSAEYKLMNIFMNPYYWAGNEPDLLAVWLFNSAGRPDLTQKFSRQLLKLHYSTKPTGIPGNDDYGAMSAWLLWANIGIYPLSGTTTYFLGSPVFPEVSITLESGKTLTVVAEGTSDENVYVESVLLNGVELPGYPFIVHSDLVAGGTLEFKMTDTPPKRKTQVAYQ